MNGISAHKSSSKVTEERIQSWLQQELSHRLDIPSEELDTDEHFMSFGLDSSEAVILSGDMSELIGEDLEASLFLEYPTMEELMDYIRRNYLEKGENEHIPVGKEENDVQEDAELKEYPLSQGQRALWFLQQVSPENSEYNIGFAVNILSGLDTEVLTRTLTKIVERHASLRMNVTIKNEQPIQSIQETGLFDLTITDVSPRTEESLQKKLKKDLHTPFNLEKDPLLRAYIYQQQDNAILMIVVHHIAIDFWGIEILLDEFRRIYQAEMNGERLLLPSLQTSYADFVYWQEQLLHSNKGEQHLEYWKQQLSNDIPALDLPLDYPRPNVQTYDGDSVLFQMDEQLTSALKDYGKQEETTLFTILIAAYQLLLHRWSSQDIVIVGTPASGRSKAAFGNIIGDFINMLPIPSEISSNPTLKQYIKEVQTTVMKGLKHQDYPFPLMVENLQPNRDPSRSPIFQASFILQKLQRMQNIAPFMVNGETRAKAEFGGMYIEPYHVPQQEGQLDLTLEIGEADGILFGAFKYNKNLFNPSTIHRMKNHYLTLLENGIEKSDCPVKKVPILPRLEEDQLLYKWNDTKTAFSDTSTLNELIDKQAEQTPDNTAVIFEDTIVTYHELRKRSDDLADYLKAKGIQPGSNVGISMTRSEQMVIGLLGILKAGAAYVPMDPQFPKERLRWIMEDSSCSFILTEKGYSKWLRDYEVDWMTMEEVWDHIPQKSYGRNKSGSNQSLAYVIYTSGSTGKPKGVKITHQAIVNFLESMAQEPGFTSDDTLLAVTTLSFDISVLELFLPLLTGGTTVILPHEKVVDGAKMKETLTDIKPTVMQATPATWRLLLESGWEGDAGLKVLCGGEPLPKDLASRLVSNNHSLWNLYGPTEAAVWMCVKQVMSTDAKITVGKPINNMETYILDDYYNPVPIGVEGELYIGGAGLAQGYLNRQDLTREKFVNVVINNRQKRLYRTGDYAKFHSDGDVEFLGRKDSQVKINGFRMELGEIESILNEYSKIEQAVAVVDGNGSDKSLTAYLVVYANETLTVEKLRSYLKQTLPDYMIPSSFMVVEKIPLTPNGKVDRGQLHQLKGKRMELETNFVPPQNLMEKRLTEIWCHTLQIEKVGVNDNFFDLGGTSMKAAQVYSALQQDQTVELSIVDLFQHPTIRTLSAHLSEQAPEDHVSRTEKLKHGKSRSAQLRHRRKQLNRG